MRRFVFCVSIVLATRAAAAVTPASPPDPQQLTVTVYNNNLALVQDIRHLNVPNGRSRLEFKNVSAAIRPETVSLSGKGLSVVEQNFDYDLLTPAKMMEKAVGHQIQILRTNPATGAQTPETATVLSVNEGVVLKIGNRIEVLRDDGIPTRVVFSSIPENLRAEPTLSVTVDAAGGGMRDTTLSYLTTGLGWRADYVALFDEKQKTIGVQGWITLTNKSGTSFNDARTQLIAGNINVTNSDDDYWQREQQRRAAEANGGTALSHRDSIADYDVFTLPERVTIAQNQTKQVSFLDAHGLKADKTYEYRTAAFASAERPDHAAVVVKFNNGDKPLPAGIVRVYMRDPSGDPKFVGEDTLDHTPAGSDLGVKIGNAFDVTVQPTVVKAEKIDHDHSRYAMSYVLRNARPEKIRQQLIQCVAQPRDRLVRGQRDEVRAEVPVLKRKIHFEQERGAPVKRVGLHHDVERDIAPDQARRRIRERAIELLEHRSQAGADQDVRGLIGDFRLVVFVLRLLATECDGDLPHALAVEDHDSFAVDVRLETLADRGDVVRKRHHLVERRGQFGPLDQADTRHGQGNERAQQLGEPRAGMPHADVGDLLQRVALVFSEFAIKHRFRIPSGSAGVSRSSRASG